MKKKIIFFIIFTIGILTNIEVDGQQYFQNYNLMEASYYYSPSSSYRQSSYSSSSYYSQSSYYPEFSFFRSSSYQKAPSEITFNELYNVNKPGLFRAPPGGGNGGIDEGEDTGEGDGDGGRNDAPIGDGIVVLLFLSIIYIIFARRSARANKVSNI